MNAICRRILAVLALVAVGLVCAGCGAQKEKTYGVNEKFKLSDYTYALEKWVRMPDLDSGSQEGYGLCLLMVGDDVPVIINGASMSSGVGASLSRGEETVSASSVDFDHKVDAPGYGVRATFGFRLPKGEELPKSAALFDATNNENRVALDLSGLAVEE